MPALAQPTAELWNTIFNVALVLGAILVLAGSWGAFWTGNMKEFYANVRISANEAQTAVANAEAAEANETAATANERAGQLEKDAAEARERTAILQKELALIKPPRLKPEQIANLTKNLPANRGAVVRIIREMGSPNMREFTKDLILAINDAGWRVFSAEIVGFGTQTKKGIIVMTNIEGPSPSQSDIIEALRKANIPFDVHGARDTLGKKVDDVELIVTTPE